MKTLNLIRARMSIFCAALLLAFGGTGRAATGDPVVVCYNADDNDEFALIALANLPVGTRYFITDSGWSTSAKDLFQEGGSPSATRQIQFDVIKFNQSGANVVLTDPTLATFNANAARSNVFGIAVQTDRNTATGRAGGSVNYSGIGTAKANTQAAYASSTGITTVLMGLSLFGFPRRRQKKIVDRKPPAFGGIRKAIFGLICLISLASAGRVSAATFNVNSFSDTHAVTPGAGTGLDSTGKISLRSALETINQIGGTQTVNLPAGTYNLTLGMITFGDVAQNVTITGASAATTIVNMTTTAQNRIFLISTTGTLPNVNTTINNVQFTGGKLTGDNYGGGAIIAGGPNNSLTLTNCIFQNNSVIAGSGLGGAGGAVRYNGGGTLTITGCTFNNNSNSDTAGGAVSFFLENLASAGSSSASITDSIFTNNSVTNTGGSGGAIHIAAQGRLTVGVTFAVSILRNTFTGNSASGPSGTGGAISVTNSFDVGNTVQVHHNRIVGNTSTIAPSALDSAGGSQGNVSATDNWWGVNTGPGNTAAKLGPGGGTLDVSTWLQLKTTASSSTLVTNQTTPLTTSFLSNSANTAISAGNLTALVGVPVTWSGLGGTVTSQQTTIQAAGTATATYNETTGVAGTHSATAVVDSGPASGSTNTVTFTVNKANVTTTITSDTPDPTVTGQAVSVGYTVAAAQGNTPTAPIGNVQVSDGVNSINGSVAGPASVALFTAGARNLTATYLGDANFNASPASASAAHLVNKADTTISITSDTPDPSNAGQAVAVNYTLSVTPPGSGTPTGNVTITDGVDTINGTTATGNVTLNNAGNRTITATYNGDANYNASPASPGAAHAVRPVVTLNTANILSNATTVTITGLGFDPTAGNNTVAFSGGATGTVSGATATQLTVTSVANLAFGNLTAVVTTNGASNSPAVQVATVVQPPAITNGPPPTSATLNQAYPNFFTYTGTGSPVPTFSVTGGALPTGMNVSAAGVISGMPTVGGTFAGTVTASNGVAPVATQPFSITVSAPPLITNGPPPVAGLRGTAYNFTYTFSGFPTPTFTVSAGALPDGLSLSSSGVISGTPGVTGTFTGTVTASNGTAPDATQAFTITINQAPAFTNGPPPSPVIVNAPYNFTFAATGSPAPTFSVPASGGAGGFPTGITMNAAGVVSGTPTGTGTTSNITVTATNTAGSVQQVFSITVNPFTTPPSAPVITSANTVTFTVGVAGSTFQMTATGSPAPTFSKTGALPSGVTLSAAGLLSGTPGAGTQGSYPITVTATNGNAPDSVQAFTLVVVTPSSITATKNDSFAAATLKSPGDTIPYTMTITNNGGADAANVVLTDPTPANTTLVAGSVHASPVAFNDFYSAVGNTKLYVGTSAPAGEPAVSVAANVLTNDTISTAPDTFLVVSFTQPTSGAGSSVTMTGAGTFTYTPKPGFTGVDTFTYKVENSADATLTDTGTVSITVSNLVWYVDNSGANGNGTSASPFNTLAGAQTASAINDFIYVKKGTATYTGGITLKNGQRFTSEAVALVVNSFTLRTAQGAVNTPTISHNATSTVTLASGNTINSFIITNSAGNGISGSAIGTTAISNIAVTVTGGTALNATGSGTLTVLGAANTLTSTTGAALNVANVNVGAGGLTFRSIAASGAASGIVLNNTGTTAGLTVTGTGAADSGGVIQNTTGSGISLTSTSHVSLTRMRVANAFNHGIIASNLGGTCLLSNSTIIDWGTSASGNDNGIDLQNSSGTLTLFTITATTFNGSTTSNAGLFMEMSGAGNATLSVEGGCTFTDMFGDGLHASTLTGATGVTSVTVKNSTFTNAAAVGNGGILMTPFGGPTTFTFDIDGNSLSDIMRPVSNAGAINVTDGDLDGGGPTVTGQIRNNTLNNIVGSRGIAVIADTFSGPLDLTIDNNNIDRLQSTSKHAINVGIRDSVTGAKVRIQNNRIGQAANLWTAGPGTAEAVLVLTQNNASANVLLTGNVITANAVLEVMRVRAIGNPSAAGQSSTLNATVTNNTLTDTNTTHIEFAAAANSSQPGGVVNLNISGNILPAAGFGVIQLTEGAANGTLNVTQASAAAVAAANSGATVTVTNTPQFGQPVPPLPLLFAPGGVEKAAVNGAANASGTAGFAKTPQLDPPSANARRQTSDGLRETGGPAGGTPTLPGTPRAVSQSELDAAVAAALARWSAAGLTDAQFARLRGLRFEVATLTDLHLGEADGDHIRVDRNAGGHGWFIGSGAEDDAPFSNTVSATRRYTDPSGAPAGRIDLLTAVLHEMGHALGLEDSYFEKDRDSLMYGYLTKGERRLPAKGQAVGAKPGAHSGMHFLTVPLAIGTLPPGKTVTVKYAVTIDAGTTANISSQGTVTADGPITVKTDDLPASGATADPTITLVAVAPAFTNGPAPSPATVFTPYAFGYTATGNPAPTFSVTGGGLPTGLILTSGGAIIGTPSAPGTFTGTVTAGNGVGAGAQQAFTIVVNQAPAFTNGPAPSVGTAGVAYNFTSTASGSPAPTFTAPGLPTGLGMSPAGAITGTPTLAGTSSGTITASNGIGSDATQNFSIAIRPAVTPSAGSVGVTATSMTINGAGFDPVFANNTVAFTGGASGTVTAATPTQLTVSVSGLSVGPLNASVTTNGVNNGSSVQVATVTTLSVTPNTLAAAVSGTAYSQTLTVVGTLPLNSLTVTSLVPGTTGLALGNFTANLVNGTLALSFTPTGGLTAPGTATFTVNVSDGSSASISQNYTLTVNPVPNAVATPASQTKTSGTAITTIVNSGNVVGTVFNWTRDNPGVTGIAASGAGNISGTLTNATNAPVTVTFTITPVANTVTGTPITATVTVNPIPNAVATPASQTTFSTTAITTIVNSGNVAGTVFNWTRDNTATATGIAAGGAGNISGSLTNTTNAPVTVTFTVTPVANGVTGSTTTATVTVNPIDYDVLTTGNAIVVTDLGGNSDTLDITEPSAGNIKFAAAARAFRLNGGAITVGDSGALALAGVTGITVNAAGGDDTINVSAFSGTSFPSLTINGGTGNDTVNMNGDITFAANASLDLNLQNDSATPGTDDVVFGGGANILTTGTGTITVKVSRYLGLTSGSSLETVNGGITLESNQQAIPSTGSFSGVEVLNAIVRSTGTGVVSLTGRGGTAAGGQMGVLVWQSSLVSGGTAGTTTVTGFGGTNAGTDNYGVNVQHVNSAITSAGSDVVVTGTGGGTGASTQNIGVAVFGSGQIAAGGSGTVTVTGFGGNPSGTGGLNVGIFVNDPVTTITSNGGAVSLTGTGGSQTGSGVSNAGIQLTTSATITAGGGNISLTGTGGGGAASNTNRGLQLQNLSVIAATGNGTVTLNGIGGGGTGSSHGTRIVQNTSVTAVNGNISITGSVTDGTTASQGFTLSNAAAVGSKVETTGSGTIAVAADTMAISTSGVTMNAGANTVTLRQKTNAVAINLGSAVDTTPSTLELAQGELNVITAGTVQIGDANSGAITISAIISPANYRTLGIGNNVSFSGTGGFASDIGPTAADIEKITVAGTVTIAPAAQLTLAATGGFVPVNGQSFPIITNDLADAISGTFFAYSEGGSIPAFLGSGITAQVTYLGGTGNDLVILTNRPPVPGVVTASRYPTQPVKLPVAQILAVATDPDLGDTISLLSVANGANGTAQIAGGYVIYTPTGNFPISHTFTYVLQDNHGATATGTVTVNVLTDNAPTNNITKFTKIAGSPAVVDFVGIPGFTYGVQYKLALADPTWLDIGPLTMNAFGAAQFTDNGPGSAPRTAAASGFYRFIYPAP